MRRRACAWCDERARYTAEGDAYCSWHIIRLYLGMHYVARLREDN